MEIRHRFTSLDLVHNHWPYTKWAQKPVIDGLITPINGLVGGYLVL